MGTSRKKESSDVTARAWEGSGKSGGAQYSVPVGCGQDWDDTLRGMEAHVRGKIVLCSRWDAVLCWSSLSSPSTFFFLFPKSMSAVTWMDACLYEWMDT